MTLPAFAAERRRLQHGAQQPLIDICCKRRRLVAAVDRWDRQTDAQSFHRHCSAYYAIGINNSVVLLKICAQQWVTVSRWLKHDVTPSTGCWPTRTQLYEYSHVGFTRHWSSDRQRNGMKKLRAVNEENYKFELASQTKRRTTFCVTANVACVLYEKK